MRMSSYRSFLFTTATPILAAVAIFLNIIEIILIVKERRARRNLGRIYILNLAISDVIVGVVMVILKSLDPYMKVELKGNVYAEEVYSVMRYCLIRLSLIVSVLNLAALTIDRVWAIHRPFSHRKRTIRFAVKICIGVWLLSIIFVTSTYCLTRFYLKDIERYNNLVFPIATYTAVVVFLVCYIMLYKTLSKSYRMRRLALRWQRCMEVNKKRKVVSKPEIKFLKLAVKTITVFCICWLPFSTCSLMKAFNVSCGGVDVEFTMFTIAYSNSVINPFIYFLHGKQLLNSELAIAMKKRFSVKTKLNSRRSIDSQRTESSFNL